VKNNPEKISGWWIRGRCSYELGKYQDAINDFTKTLTLQTTGNDNVYYYRGLAHEALGNSEEACADYNAANAGGNSDAAAKVANCD